MESYPEKMSFGGESEEMPVLVSQGIVERVSEESRNVKGRGERRKKAGEKRSQAEHGAQRTHKRVVLREARPGGNERWGRGREGVAGSKDETSVQEQSPFLPRRPKRCGENAL